VTDAEYLAQMQAYRAELKAWAANLKAPKRKPRKPRGHVSDACPPPGEHQAKTDGRAKLTPEDVRRIRQRHAAGENRNDLAAEFRVTARSINLIAQRRRWAHVQ
jgi:hypothetical protein